MADEEKKESEEAGNEEETGDPEKKSGLKKILIIVIPVIVLLGGAGFYFFGMSGPDPIIVDDEHTTQDDSGHDTPQGGHEAAAKPELSHQSYFVEMPPITVNLRREGPNQQRYLKLSVRFEVRDYGHVDVLENIMPRIRDQFQVFLRELRVDDLEGSTGAYRIREELLHRINIVARPAVVTDVLFDELLIQ